MILLPCTAFLSSTKLEELETIYSSSFGLPPSILTPTHPFCNISYPKGYCSLSEAYRGDERRTISKSRWKRVFKRDSANAKEPNNLAEHKTANVPANPAGQVSSSNRVRVSTSTVLIEEQSTTDPSTLIPAPSEKISQTRTKDKMNRTTGVSEAAGVAAPNPIQKQATDILLTETSPTSLWDEAYDFLKQERPELLSGYEDLLSRVLINAEANSRSVPNQEGDAIDVRNQIPQHNAAARREKLKLIAELGLKHMEDKKIKLTILGHVVDVQDGVGKIGDAVDLAQSYIKDAIKDVPYAPAVMAGISLILPLLKNPAAIDAANREGLTYVTSQMRYYVEMESLLLPSDLEPDLKADLMKHVVHLYKLIIDFQVQSVIRFYRNRTKNYFRSVINYDNWSDQLKLLKEEETRLAEKFERALSATGVQQLKKLAKDAEGSREALSNILYNIQELVDISRSQKDILERTEQRLSNAEDRRCRDALQATDPSLDKARIEEDKGGLLRDSYCWVLDHVDFRRWRDRRGGQLLWIKGDPGKGKTMLLCGIIDELSKMAMHDANISYFFCQATTSRLNNAAVVLRGLIYMLVQQQPAFIRHISDVSFEGENAWFALLRVFTNILEDSHLKSTFLIIDALDECTTDLSRLLHLLVQKSTAYSHVQWVVSSRNWPSIENGLNGTNPIELNLELNEHTLSAAINSFIQHKINELTDKNKYSPEVRAAVQHHVESKANGTFLWVALVCKELATVPKRHVLKKLKEFPPGLDKLYKRMWEQMSESDDAQLCKSLLGVMTTVYRPITLDELTSCIDLPEDFADDQESLSEVIGFCGSFLTLRGRTISLVHQSAKDFLLREAFDEIFPKGADNIHYSIFSKSLQAIARTLHRDIYSLVAPGYPIDQVKKPDQDPLAATRYACVYWVDHLNECSPSKNTNEDLQESGSVGRFLQQDYLHWLEALSLSKSLAKGVASMLKLERLLKRTTENSPLINRLRDARRFVLYYKTVIENYPLQVYAAGLIFSPASSITRNQFKISEPAWLIRKPTTEESWSACLQTLEGHSDEVTSATFSHDSRLLASASGDNTIKVWDASSGQCIQTLEGHSDLIYSVMFSHDSKLLTSASKDNTIKVWDAHNSQCLQTIKEHSSSVYSVIFSYDSKLLASASEDNTIKVLDPSNSRCIRTLKGHCGSVYSVTISHDSMLLASASLDETIRIWDVSNGQCIQTLEGHSGPVYSVTFSDNLKLLASASFDETVRVWDTSNGQCIQILKGHSTSVHSVAFSHSSKLLASASADGTIKVWDASNGQCLQTLEGHSGLVHSVTFSHDSLLLASASSDKTINVWDASNCQSLQMFEAHSSWVHSVTFSHDSKLITSASADGTIKLWDAGNSKCLQTLEDHSGWSFSIFSNDSKLLATASYDETISVWDVSNSQCIQILKGHSTSVHSVAFSHSSKLLASASADGTIKVWDASNGQCLQTLEGHCGLVHSVTFSHDSLLLASASSDKTINVWDASNCQSLQMFEAHSSWVHSVTFSHDSKLITSASADGTIKLWDAGNSKCLQTLEDHSGWSFSIFSNDSKLLATASYDETISVWDVSNSQCIQILKGHIGPINSVTFSHDSKLLASASYDETIKVWDISNGRCLQTLDGHSMSVSSVTFSHDLNLKLLASASGDETVKVWDASNGQCLQTLKGHSGWVYTVTFSHDSKLLASASDDETIKVWEISNGQCLQTFEGHGSSVRSVIFSNDSKLLASGSYDKTIKVWDASSGQCLKTLKIDRIAYLKSFDMSNSCLETYNGTIYSLDLDAGPTDTEPEVARSQGYGVTDQTWITWNSKYLLWLPPDYRPRTFAVSRSTQLPPGPVHLAGAARIHYADPKGGDRHPARLPCHWFSTSSTTPDLMGPEWGRENIGYIDDATMHATGDSEHDTCQRLREHYRRGCLRWAATHASRFGPSKFQLIHFHAPGPGAQSGPGEPLDLGDGQVVEAGATARLLGVTLDQHLTLEAHLKHVDTAATRRLQAISALGGSKWGLRLRELRHIYTACITPIMLYAASVWYAPPVRGRRRFHGQQTKILNRIQRRAGKLIVGAFQTVSGAAFDAELHLTPMPLLLRQRRIQTLI
ncbi:hypothetical protein CNMCM7691_003574 [Aspergillus felis]|uniref:NACHT domain-containing protein n=1 Tax=Aspergillus felis TaxID=1287682 RepID=A0A8H6R1A2_9EURO|nr:hypothetical protein CNMCM7691_003574 [Aspergillus felis]